MKVQGSIIDATVLKVPPKATVSHLLFADDILLFMRATPEATLDVVNVLELYCKASGQRVNLKKSSVYFSKGVPNELKDAVKNT